MNAYILPLSSVIDHFIYPDVVQIHITQKQWISMHLETSGGKNIPANQIALFASPSLFLRALSRRTACFMDYSSEIVTSTPPSLPAGCEDVESFISSIPEMDTVITDSPSPQTPSPGGYGMRRRNTVRPQPKTPSSDSDEAKTSEEKERGKC